MTTAVYAEIAKFEKQADGTLKVWGKATGSDLDSDLQICDPVWLAKAMPEWFQFGNIREMHGAKAAGVGTTLEQDGFDWNLEAHVVDPDSCLKVEEKVLKGFSVGIRGAKVIKDVAAPGGRIIGGDIVEISLVDRPANPTCTLMLAKWLGGSLIKVDETVVDGVDQTAPDTAPAPVATDDGSAEPSAEEAAELGLLEQAVAAIKQLLVGEATELAEGMGGLGPVRILTYVLDELLWFAECDAYDDAAARIESMKAATTEEVMNLAQIATLTKAAVADDASDEDKVAVADLVKALGIETMIEEKIATRMTEAATVQDLDKVAARIAQVETVASNNGPTRVPALAATDDRKSQLLTKAATYRQQALTVHDRDLAASYRAMATQAEAEANTIS